MTNLFDKNAKYTVDAEILETAIQKAIEPIMREYAEKGFNIRDIYTIAHLTAVDTMTEIIIDNDMKNNELRKLEKEVFGSLDEGA